MRKTDLTWEVVLALKTTCSNDLLCVCSSSERVSECCAYDTPCISALKVYTAPNVMSERGPTRNFALEAVRDASSGRLRQTDECPYFEVGAASARGHLGGVGLRTPGSRLVRLVHRLASLVSVRMVVRRQAARSTAGVKTAFPLLHRYACVDRIYRRGCECV